MSTRKTVAVTLALLLAAGTAPGTVLAGQQPQTSPQPQGVLEGKASEATKPFEDFSVQLRDPLTAQVVQRTTLTTDQGLFRFTGVDLSRRYLIELVNVRDNRLVCTEGPFVLTTGRPTLSNIDINCGGVPSAVWLILAGAGAAAGIAVLKRSGG